MYANQYNATPSLWLNAGALLGSNLVVDNNGDLIYCEFGSYGNIKKIDKNTKAITTISQQKLKDALIGAYSSTLALDMDQTNGDLFGLYYGLYPNSGGSVYNLFKAARNISGLYEAVDFATEMQVLEDEDIEPWVDTNEIFFVRAGGLVVYPGGNYFFCTSGSNNVLMGLFAKQGIDCIVKIGTEAKLEAMPGMWFQYE